MQNSEKLFFELVLMSTGARSELSRPYAETDWLDALELSRRQAVNGVLFSAVERLPKEQCPTIDVLANWLKSANNVELHSKEMFPKNAEVVEHFRLKGFPCTILKGASVSRYYPQPMRRVSGDIDVWLDGGRSRIYEMARNFDPQRMLYGVNYHHIHYHLFPDVHLEVHIWPSCLSSPLRNWRFHRFCRLHRPSSDRYLTELSFDRVFILLHCYSHITGAGVGLRQLMDYYYVLRQGFSEEERRNAVHWIGQLGMARFLRGTMWVMHHVFGLDREFFLVEPDEKEGRFILNEVMLTGNMGHYDSREWGSRRTPLRRFFFNLRRSLYLASHYPHEALWQPFFSLWLYAWRLAKGLLKDREE